MEKIKAISLYLFSFFLAFGKFDPFGTNGLYFDILTAATIGIVLITSNVVKEWRKYKNQLIPLFLIGIILFFTGLLYGPTIFEKSLFNFKYFAAIIVFWTMSIIFESDKIRINSILLFSISCGVLALLYHFQFFAGVAEIHNGRLNIFGENPNSISTRMALAFIVIFYYVIENPLRSSKIRFVVLVFLPYLLLFVIETASRGSFLIMLLGAAVILLFSKVHKSVKLAIVFFAFGLGAYFSFLLYDSGLYERFQEDDVSGGRERIWANAINIFYENPIGVGEAGYTNEMFQRFSTTQDTHNLFLYILITGGVASLILYFVFLWQIFFKAFHALKINKVLNMTLFIFMLLLSAKTGGVITYLIMWYFFAVVNSFSYKKL